MPKNLENQVDLDKTAVRVLRRLREPGSVLIAIRGARVAGVYSGAGCAAFGTDGCLPHPTATAEPFEVATLAKHGWIVRNKVTKNVAQFVITQKGRKKILRLVGGVRSIFRGARPTPENLLRWSYDRMRRRQGRLV